MTPEQLTHAAKLERARATRAPYNEAARRPHSSWIKLTWLHVVGWPTELFGLFGFGALAQGDLRDGLPALGFACGWAGLVALVVAFVTGSIRAAGRQLDELATHVSGIAFRSPRPDRVLSWLDRYWADDVPRTIVHDPLGVAYFVGAEFSYLGAPVLILGVRGSFWPRVHVLLLFSAQGERVPQELTRARVELGELGYVVSVVPSGVLLTRERAPANAFEFAAVDRVLRLTAELARAAHGAHVPATAGALRADLRALAIARFEPILHFDEHELALNAAGRLSARQRRSSTLRGALWTAGALCLGGSALYHAALLARAPTEGSVSGGIVLVLIALVALGLAFVAGRFLNDAIDGHAALVLGPLRHSMTHGGKGGTHHWLHCGPMRFSASPAVAYAIEAGVIYRVYFAAHSHRLLSLERADP